MKDAIKRTIIVALGVILQFGFFILIQLYFHDKITIIRIIYNLLSISIILKIIKDSTSLSNDLPWIILILLFPIFGTILLITLGTNINNTEKNYQKYLTQNPQIQEEINHKELDNLKYIINYSKYPVTTNNTIKYYNLGDKFYPQLLESLQKA